MTLGPPPDSKFCTSCFFSRQFMIYHLKTTMSGKNLTLRNFSTFFSTWVEMTHWWKNKDECVDSWMVPVQMMFFWSRRWLLRTCNIFRRLVFGAWRLYCTHKDNKVFDMLWLCLGFTVNCKSWSRSWSPPACTVQGPIRGGVMPKFSLKTSFLSNIFHSLVASLSLAVLFYCT